MAMGITIDGLERLGADLKRLERPGLRNAINRALRGPGGEALESQMRQRAPRRSGKLAGGLGIRGVGRDDTEIGYLGSDDRGVFVESGAKPHKIRPKRRGGALYVNSRWLKEVDHPGMRGMKVASRSIRAAQWEVEAAVVDEINMMLDGA